MVRNTPTMSQELATDALFARLENQFKKLQQAESQLEIEKQAFAKTVQEIRGKDSRMGEALRTCRLVLSRHPACLTETCPRARRAKLTPGQHEKRLSPLSRKDLGLRPVPSLSRRRLLERGTQISPDSRGDLRSGKGAALPKSKT